MQSFYHIDTLANLAKLFFFGGDLEFILEIKILLVVDGSKQVMGPKFGPKIGQDIFTSN